jgi:hypothetical protein
LDFRVALDFEASMNRGRKPEALSTKAARGTLQPCRDDGRTQVIVPGDPPMMPDTLSIEAQMIWADEIGRVMATGVADADSSLFADYCELTALIRKAWSAAEAPPAAYLSEQRRRAEMLGIAGPKSRVMSADPQKATNPFARNGRR